MLEHLRPRSAVGCTREGVGVRIDGAGGADGIESRSVDISKNEGNEEQDGGVAD
jgi:hypothetical protein